MPLERGLSFSFILKVTETAATPFTLPSPVYAFSLLHKCPGYPSFYVQAGENQREELEITGSEGETLNKVLRGITLDEAAFEQRPKGVEKETMWRPGRRAVQAVRTARAKVLRQDGAQHAEQQSGLRGWTSKSGPSHSAPEVK